MPFSSPRFIGLCSFLSVSCAIAQPTSKPPAPHTAQLGGLQWELGLTAYQETYREVGSGGQRIMQEKAAMAGVQARVTLPLNLQWSARLSAEYARGESKYTGSAWGGSYGSLHASGIGREKIQAQAEILFRPPTWGATTLTAGLLARRLNDALDRLPAGYERTNTGYFGTLGVEQHIALSHGWALRPAIQYLHLLDGTQKADLDGGLRLKQKKGHGWEASATFQQLRADGSGLQIRPFWRYFKMGASETVDASSASYIEPENSTRELGVDLRWKF